MGLDLANTHSTFFRGFKLGGHVVRFAWEKTPLEREWRMKGECKDWAKGDHGEAAATATRPGLGPAPGEWQ